MDFASLRRKKGWMNLRVDQVIHETHDTDTFVMTDADDGGRAFDYIAGQYLTFRFDDVGAKPVVRSYTMSSSPCQPDFVAFTVKRVEGGLISNWLCDKVRPGSILKARGPIGKFCWDPDTDHPHLFMVAGGSGVTPFVSIIREYVSPAYKGPAPAKMTLLVSHRSRQDLICHKDLMAAAADPRVRIITTLTRDPGADGGFWHGRIDDAMMTRAVGGHYGGTTYMSCGPQAIMDTAKGHLEKAGVAPEHIKTESFES